MLVEVYRRCYDFAGRDEFKVIPYKCPVNKQFCFGGYVWIGEESPVYDIKEECKCYDNDSFKVYDNCVECNFYLGTSNDKQMVIRNCMDIYSKNGTKVRFADRNPDGYNISKKSAELLTLGEVYTIDHTDVSSWSTDVYLKEFPNVAFNSVWFDEVKEVE